MKKRDLLFAGLLLAGVPVLAQTLVQHPETDPAVIFEQGFEQDWNAWSKDSIDVIDTIYYYVNNPDDNNGYSDSKVWENWADWTEKIERTDSVIPLYRGNVVKTDAASEIANYEKDTYDIITEESQGRYDIFSSYGEDGGSKVFKYVSDSNGVKAWWQQSADDHSPEYRRNLFVRLTPGTIQPNTNYRITFFIKAQDANNGKKSAPRINADLMRGYFHSEKPFTMGLEDDADHYKYKTRFEWTKTDFTKDWEKVTYMSYYLNDSIAEQYVFVHSYYWTSDWTWKTKVGDDSVALKYVAQPNKFFVRIAFSGDNTEYQFDNLSLMRSNIAGANYNGDKIRIDFGYKNNIMDLVAEAKKVTGIDAVEVPFDEDSYNFEVWGQDKTTDEWKEIYIRSAEYHSDGYLYMFTDYETLPDGTEVFYNFNNYKKILISFKNPTNPRLQLKYTGTGKDLANAFPNALDTNWIKAGKIIPDLVNEIGTPVPASAFKDVYSMKDLPPLLTGVEYEDNSFGLTPTDVLKFGFSRRLAVDNSFLGTNTDNVVALINGKAWIPSLDPQCDTILVLTRPNDAPALSGDVEIKLIQLYGASDGGNARITKAGENVTKYYNFSPITRSFAAPDVVYETNLASEDNANESVPLGVAKVDNNSNGYSVGTGIKASGSRLYYFAAGGQFTRGMYFAPRAGSLGAIYWGVGDYPIRLAKGRYSISFYAIGWDGTHDVKLYMYPKPAVNPNVLADANKTLVTTFKCTNYLSSGSVSKNGETTVSNADAFSFTFSADADTAYIFEFRITSSGNGNWHGDVISDLKFTEALPLSYGPVTALNNSVDAAKARLALANADANSYGGTTLSKFATKIEYYDYNPEGGFKPYPTEPSKWAAAKKDLDDATAGMKSRMDTVDTFIAQKAAIATKLTDTQASYSGLTTYAALQEKQTEALAYPVTRKTGAEIYAYNEELKAAVKALDDRIALNGKFGTAVARAKALLDDSARIDYEEYTALDATYKTYKDYNVISATDDEINATYAIIVDAASAYDNRVVAYNTTTVRIKALDALAKKLGSTIADSAIVKSQMQELDGDNDDLAKVFMAAIKLAIYDKAVKDPVAQVLDSLDVTPFIKNYSLYTTAQLGARNSKESVDKTKEVNVLSIQTGWGNPPQYTDFAVATRGEEFTTTFPGWTFKSFGGQNYIGQEKVDWTAEDFHPVFDAYLASDWSSQAVITQEVVDLPVGQYTLGAALTMDQDAGNNSTLNATVTKGKKTYSANVSAKTGGHGSTPNTFIDSIKIAAQDTMLIKMDVPSHNSWVWVDNFVLAFRPDKDADYEDLMEGLADEISALLTVVDASKAQAANVEFFNLGGMKINSPKAGDILIRKTTVGGKVVVDKVLLK